MKNNSIKYLFFWMLFLCSCHLWAATPEAEFKKLTETWTLQNDGSQEYRYSKELTLFTHTAMNSTYGQTFITYNPNFQELKIHNAYVKQKDGTIVQTPANAFVEVLPSNAADAPAYNHLKELVIVHTGLELGATIYLDYSILSKPGYFPEIDVCKFLQETSPIKEYTLTFNLPESKTPHYQILQLKNKPIKSNQQGIQQLKWTFRNLPALSREPEISLQNGDLAGLLFTTYPTVTLALQKLYRQFDQIPTPQITELAKTLTQSCQSNAEKIQKIQEYIQTCLGFSPLTLPETGFRLRPAADVISTAYGTEAEKINLMTNLLKASGIDAIPAATYALPTEPDYCGLNAIQELIVLAQADHQLYRLHVKNTQPAAESCSFLVNLTDGKKSQPDHSTASIDYQASIVITPEKEGNVDIKAIFSNRFIPYSANYAHQLLPGIHDYSVTPESETTTITGKCKANLKKEQDYTFLYLPTTSQGIDAKSYAYYNSSREKNLYLPTLVHESYSYEIQLPENFILSTPAQEENIENSVGKLKITISYTGSTVRVDRFLHLNKQLITPAEYPAFRKLMTEWKDSNGKPLLFKSYK